MIIAADAHVYAIQNSTVLGKIVVLGAIAIVMLVIIHFAKRRR